VPVIGANLGGIPELIRHEQNGLLFQPDDASDLAVQLQRLLDEPNLLPRLRRGTLPFYSTWEEMIQLERIYERVINSQQGALLTPSLQASCGR
ncbi:MAG: glycosyltransferase, partial [Anaerolineae bacterium]|nr:glycosyltransferase [Thermoflexus sp.]MDW8066022.1 glycosyltransferase [Anaerolineae bacterium]